MHGNTHIRSILDSYIDTILQTGTVPVPFMILVGPSGLGKYEYALSLGKKVVGEYIHQDFKVLRDCSRDIGKDHSIKIEAPKEDEIELLDGSIYSDLGIREINQRLVRAPAGKWKVLVIQNAERMTEGASNALLKMLEEPLPGRVIIATCSRQSQILPTILSRGLLCSFYPIDENEILSYIAQHTEFSQYNTEWLVALASGRPGILDELRATPDHLEQLNHIFNALQDTKIGIAPLYKALVSIAKIGHEQTFLQAYINRLASKGQRDKVKLTQETFAMTNYSTLNTEHILFDFVTAHYAATHS